MQNIITYQEFEQVELRSGTIIKAEKNQKAKRAAFLVTVDFGPDIGQLISSAQITTLYTPETLVGKQVIGCVNIGEKNIAGFVSQFLLVGFADEQGAIVLVTVDRPVPNGKKLH